MIEILSQVVKHYKDFLPSQTRRYVRTPEKNGQKTFQVKIEPRKSVSSSTAQVFVRALYLEPLLLGLANRYTNQGRVLLPEEHANGAQCSRAQTVGFSTRVKPCTFICASRCRFSLSFSVNNLLLSHPVRRKEWTLFSCG